MAEHPNVARIRRGYEIRGTRTAFSDEDWAEIKDLFHEGLAGRSSNVYSDDTPGREFVDQAPAALSAEAVARATEAGRRLTIQEALDLARANGAAVGS